MTLYLEEPVVLGQLVVGDPYPAPPHLLPDVLLVLVAVDGMPGPCI